MTNQEKLAEACRKISVDQWRTIPSGEETVRLILRLPGGAQEGLSQFMTTVFPFMEGYVTEIVSFQDEEEYFNYQ